MVVAGNDVSHCNATRSHVTQSSSNTGDPFLIAVLQPLLLRLIRCKDWTFEKILRGLIHWRQLQTCHQVVVACGALVLVLAAGYFGYRTTQSCSSRADVEARVALVSSELQDAAAQGKLSVEKLAEGIKRLNEASTAYNANNDHQAYCGVLNELRGEF